MVTLDRWVTGLCFIAGPLNNQSPSELGAYEETIEPAEPRMTELVYVDQGTQNCIASARIILLIFYDLANDRSAYARVY